MKRGTVLINANDIIGKRLGKLEVNEYIGSYYSDTRGGERMRHTYMCQCDCGKCKTAQRGQLLNETIHSCGCLK